MPTVSASSFYRDHLGQPVMSVPRGNNHRLNSWPALKPTNVYVKQGDTKNACADVVLSSAGECRIYVTSC